MYLQLVTFLQSLREEEKGFVVTLPSIDFVSDELLVEWFGLETDTNFRLSDSLFGLLLRD